MKLIGPTADQTFLFNIFMRDYKDKEQEGNLSQSELGRVIQKLIDASGIKIVACLVDASESKDDPRCLIVGDNLSYQKMPFKITIQ